MACDYETEFRCGDGEHNLLKKILGRLAQLVGLAGGGGGVGDTVTLTVSDIEIGAVEIKDGDTDARAKVITACPDPADRGLVVRNIPCGTQAISAASLPLPTGAMTEASFLARTNTLGQKNMSGSMPVVLAADQPPIIFTLNGASIIGVCPGEFDQGLVVRNIPCGTQAISAVSLPLPTGAATETTLSSVANFLDDVATNTFQSVAHLAAIETNTVNIEANTLNSAASLANIEARTPVLGPATMANSSPVVIASDQSALPVSTKTALTASAPTSASVGVATAEAVASNASRKGLTLVNLSVNRISLGFGSAAVLDSGITLYPGDSFSMEEYCFSTAAVNAIASAAASALAIQEFTT